MRKCKEEILFLEYVGSNAEIKLLQRNYSLTVKDFFSEFVI